MTETANSLGTQKISKLLIKQAIPASIGILVMSLNMIVDTIFVGRWIGPLAISAITVVIPITFFIAALGLAIGIGGSRSEERRVGKESRGRWGPEQRRREKEEQGVHEGDGGAM